MEQITQNQLRYLVNLAEYLGQENMDKLLSLAGVESFEELDKKRSSALIGVAKMLLDAGATSASNEVEEMLNEGLKVAEATMPEETSVDVKADIAARVGITLYLQKQRG